MLSECNTHKSYFENGLGFRSCVFERSSAASPGVCISFIFYKERRIIKVVFIVMAARTASSLSRVLTRVARAESAASPPLSPLDSEPSNHIRTFKYTASSTHSR